MRRPTAISGNYIMPKEVIKTSDNKRESEEGNHKCKKINLPQVYCRRYI